MTEHLVLVAHGAVDTPRSNQPIVELASEIADTSQFQSVTPAFLNGSPRLTEVLEHLEQAERLDESNRVVVVPVMTSQGYYLKKIPDLIQQNSNVAKFDLRMTTVAGMHPAMSSIMCCRLQKQLDRLGAERPVTVIVVGHGTRKNATSGQSTIALTKSIEQELKERSDRPMLRFETGFLDQDPELETVFNNIPADTNVVALPFLVALGPHMTDDVPNAMGLHSGPSIEFPLIETSEARTIICEPPIGMYPEMSRLVVELAQQPQTKISDLAVSSS